MRIVYHLGAHCTDEERLLKCLLKNRGTLAREDIVVPGPMRYRNLIRDTAVNLQGRAASRDTQALVLDQIMDESRAERLILSWDNFLAFPQWALRGSFYPTGGERLRAITQIFPEIEAEFHLAIRNPASFLPALLEKQRGKSYDDFMKGTRPEELFWSDTVRDILAVNPDVPLYVWCDEDTPLIWPEVLRSVAGHAPETRLEDTDDLLASIMSPDGLRRMQAYLQTHPPRNDAARRKVVAAFLDKFVLPEQIEVELDLPGWTEDLIEDLSDQYDEDVARIAALPGVTLLTP
ncbi:MAG: hypothetical protein U1D35_17175 [Paracoccaceae bacterium]|nr:hypothetical protein [Paracoccaceae bacterium]